MKKCPFCAEEIQDEAVKCKHCGSRIPSTTITVLRRNVGEWELDDEATLEQWFREGKIKPMDEIYDPKTFTWSYAKNTKYASPIKYKAKGAAIPVIEETQDESVKYKDSGRKIPTTKTIVIILLLMTSVFGIGLIIEGSSGKGCSSPNADDAYRDKCNKYCTEDLLFTLHPEKRSPDFPNNLNDSEIATLAGCIEGCIVERKASDEMNREIANDRIRLKQMSRP